MSTLREILDEMRTRIDDLSQVGWHDAANEVAVYADSIESWAYGQERRECPTCNGAGEIVAFQTLPRGVSTSPSGRCATCHGTGTIREPGLVERVHEGRDNISARRLREELGEADES